MITILDYEAGNLTSVDLALRHLGVEATISRDPEQVRSADRIVFPGVGAAGSTMSNLQRLELDHALREAHAAGTPILGICIGCQVLLDESEEDARDGVNTSCLGLIPGRVVRFRFGAGMEQKTPQIGWNPTRIRRPHEVVDGIADGSQFYYVHGYHVRPTDERCIVASATYGDVEFNAILADRNLVAVQFHTEKSGPPGLRLLRNFLRWQPESCSPND